MKTGIAIKLEYCTIGKYMLDGMEEFETSLSENYITVIRPRPGGLGGGLNHFIVDFISQTNLEDISKLVQDGIIFDALKYSGRTLIIKPFIAAVKKLIAINKHKNVVGISELNITFKDSILKIYNIRESTLLDQLEEILKIVSTNYVSLILPTGEKPYMIHLPLFNDLESGKLPTFRTLFDFDEPIQDASDADYYKYWGIYYDWDGSRKVFEVKERLLHAKTFFLQSEYWQEIDRRNKA